MHGRFRRRRSAPAESSSADRSPSRLVKAAANAISSIISISSSATSAASSVAGLCATAAAWSAVDGSSTSLSSSWLASLLRVWLSSSPFSASSAICAPGTAFKLIEPAEEAVSLQVEDRDGGGGRWLTGLCSTSTALSGDGDREGDSASSAPLIAARGLDEVLWKEVDGGGGGGMFSFDIIRRGSTGRACRLLSSRSPTFGEPPLCGRWGTTSAGLRRSQQEATGPDAVAHRLLRRPD